MTGRFVRTYHVVQHFTYQSNGQGKVSVVIHGDEEIPRESSFIILNRPGPHTRTVTKRNALEPFQTATFQVVTADRHTITPTNQAGVEYIVSRNENGFAFNKSDDRPDDQEGNGFIAEEQEAYDAFDIGILLYELDAEAGWNPWNSLPRSSTFCGPLPDRFPADMEAEIEARRILNAARRRF